MIVSTKYLIAASVSVSLMFSASASAVAYQDADETIPTVGKPRDITPKPYIPKGAIQLPRKPNQDADLDVKGDDTSQEIPPIFGEEGYVEDTLAEPDPSGIGIFGPDADAAKRLWGDKDRTDIITHLSALKKPLGSKAVHQKLLAVLGTSIPLARPEDDAGVAELMATRLDRMLALRDWDGFMALSANLAKDVDWQGLTLYQMQEALASGRMLEACALANDSAGDESMVWLKLKTFCEAVGGNRMAVDFQLSVIEEFETPTPAFYQLIDTILLEAESGGSSTKPEINGLPVDVLEVIMARVAGAKVVSLSEKHPNPLAVPLLLAQPGLSREAGVELIGPALKNNWISQKDLTAFVEKNDANLEEVTNLDSFMYDLALIKTIQNESSNSFDRIEALNSARNRGEQFGYGNALYDFYFDFIQQTVPSVELMNQLGLFTEISLTLGDLETAQNWYNTARSLPVSQSSMADEALIKLWPYMHLISDETDINMTALRGWWHTTEGEADRYQKASLIFTTLDAMGHFVPLEAWGWLEDGPVVTSGRAVSTAHWRKFLRAATAETKIDLYVSLSELFERDDALDPTVVGSILTTLNEVGEGELAKAIALETVLKAGL